MADLENTATNTAGEAGSNTNPFNAEEVANLVLKIANERYPKVERSIAKSNFEKYSPEEQEQAFAALEDLKNRETRKQKEAFEKIQKELEKANAKIAEYETEKRNTLIKQNSIDVLNSLEIKEQKDISLIQDLAGDKLYACVKEDGSFDSEKAKTLFEDITKRYGLSFEKKKEQENPYFRLGGNPQGNSSVKKTKSFHQAIEENLKF